MADKKFRIILYTKEGYLPQYGLEYSSKEAARKVAEYLNSLIPPNLSGTQVYIVTKIDEILS